MAIAYWTIDLTGMPTPWFAVKTEDSGTLRKAGVFSGKVYPAIRVTFRTTLILPGRLSSVIIFPNVFFKEENFNARSRG